MIVEVKLPEISENVTAGDVTKGLVKADPWSQYTSPDKGCDWVKQQGTYQKKA